MLSIRATEHVSGLDRRQVISTPDDVRDAFATRSLRCPDAILEFQSKFGGLILNAGLEPLVATVLHPQANFLRDRPWNVPDVADQNGLMMFNCIDTLYQMEFHLDEHGCYYEDWQPVHASFEKLLEGNAFLAWRSAHGKWSMIRDPETEVGSRAQEFQSHGLKLDESASCQHTAFWYNDAIIVRARRGDLAAWRNEESQITMP